jgi:hypothetical protein
MSRCPDCGERSPNLATFCIVCGACLRPPATLPSNRIASATGPTVRLRAANARTARQAAPAYEAGSPRRASISQGLIPLLGLLFGVLFITGFAQLIAIGGLSVSSLSLAAVLVGGGLVAERAWVNGELWRGSRGMLLWSALLWLLATDSIFPWAPLALLGWCALHPRWYGRRP